MAFVDHLAKHYPRHSLLLCICCFLAASGCNGFKSRYAMSDPVYAKKYAEGAERGDLLGKAKQALDARHVAGLSGWFLSGGTQYRAGTDSTLGGADIGFEYYPTSWFSQRASLGTYWGGEEGYLGGDVGLRAQLPARVTPFVGVGATAGASNTVKLADDDGQDNDDDDLIDERGETTSDIDKAFIGAYPEVGMHAWLNGKWRLSGYGRYLLTSLGRDQDDWLIGGQLTYFPQRPHFDK
jgi:hypothetical protein